MLTVFQIDGEPDYIYFCKSENFEQVLGNRDTGKEYVISQELSMEQLLMLTEGKTKMFTLCLYKPK